MKNKDLIWKIVYCVGAAVALAYIFIPIEFGKTMWDFLVSSETTSAIGMALSFTDYQIFADYPILVKIILYWAPALIMVVTAVLVFVKSNKKVLDFILGAIGAAWFIIIDIFLIANEITYAGLYMNIAGAVIAIVGLLVFFLSEKQDIQDENNYYGEVKCVAGEFAGGVFAADNVLVVGKDADQCNLILSNKTVSRIHCIITYVSATDTYTVKDVSKNGTFFSDGKRLVKEFEMQVPRGTEIYLGEPKERFILN